MGREGLELKEHFAQAEEALDFTAETAQPLAVAEVDSEALAIADNFEITKSKIAAMKQACAGLTIAGVEDRKGYDLVHSHRMQVRDARTGVDKIRKALKESVLARGRKIDSVAKELTALLVEIEEPLEAEEKRIDAEREKIKAEAQRKRNEEIQARIEALQAVGHPVNLAEISIMNDTAYGFLLATATDAWKVKEAQRIEAEAALAKQKAEQEAKEAAERKAKEEAEAAERARLEKQRQEQAAEAKRLADAQAELNRQAADLKAKRDAQERADREKKIAEDAAAKAKAEAERIAAEETARKAREKAEADARAKAAEAARPDAEKIRALAQVVREIALPVMATDSGKAAMGKIGSAALRFATYIEGEADTLSPVTLNAAP